MSSVLEPVRETHASSPESSTSPADRHFGAAVTGFLALFALMGWIARPSGVGANQDDSIYMALARSILRGGYNEIYRLDEPLHTLYPPVYPMLLAGLSALFGESFSLYAAAGVLVTTGALALFILLVRRLWSPELALLCLVPLALNPHLILSAGKIGTEGFYLFFSVLSLWFLANPRRGEGLSLRLSGASAIVATLTRSVGLPLLAALTVEWALQRRFRAVGLFFLVCVGTVGLWFLWTLMAPEQFVGSSYVADATFSGGSEATSLPAVIADRVVHNVPAYLHYPIPNRIGIPELPGMPALNLLVAGGIAVAVAVGLARIWRRWRLAALYVLAYLGMLAVWPWIVGRFLNPIIPFLVLGLLLGTGAIAARVHPKLRTPALLAVTAALLLAGVLRTGKGVIERTACRWDGSLPPAECRVGGDGRYFSALEVLDRASPRDARLLTGKPSVSYFFTERQGGSFGGATSAGAPALFEYLERNGIDYVLLSGIYMEERTRLAPMLAQRCTEFVLEASFPPDTYLLRVGRGEQAAGESTCRVIDAYVAAAPPLIDSEP